MSGKIYNKDLTFLQDQPFAEKILTGFSYKRRRAKLSSIRDSYFTTKLFNSDTQPIVGIPSFGSNRVRNKSEKMKKAETRLVKHFCLFLERTGSRDVCDTVHNMNYNSNSAICSAKLSTSWMSSSRVYKVGNANSHLLVSVESMRNTLLATRTFRSSERVKNPSQFKKILRECRKIRLLYGNLSKRDLSRTTSKMRFPGENLLIWLESRLDVVLERCGFFGSIKAARQSVLNGKIIVNSKVVRSPGFILQGGDFIKVVQERLPPLPLKVRLPRGVILSNAVFPRLARNESLPFSLFKTRPILNSTLQLTRSSALTTPYTPTVNLLQVAKRPDFALQSSKAEHELDYYRSPVSVPSNYSSFHNWLLKKKEKDLQSNEYLERQSLALPLPELRLKVLSAQNTVHLGKKVSSRTLTRHSRVESRVTAMLPCDANSGRKATKSCTSSDSSSNNWRFIGSPHLLFSFFFLHTYLEKIISSVTRTFNKGVLIDKEFVKVNYHKTQKLNNINSNVFKSIEQRSAYCSDISNIGDYTLPSIYSVLNYCAINTLTINSNLFLSQPIKGKRTLKNTSKIELLINLIRQSFQKNIYGNSRSSSSRFDNKKVSQSLASLSENRTFTDTQNFSSATLRSSLESHVRITIEVYNKLFTSPWFTQLDQDDSFSKDLDLLQLPSGVIRKDERGLLCVLLSDVLLYSLFIKKQILCAQLKKEQIGTKNKKIFRSSPVSVPSRNDHTGGRQKAFDLKMNYKSGLPVSVSQAFVENSNPSKVNYNNIKINQGFVFNQSSRLKPLHLEISYQSLCAIYLYPPQRFCLPIMVDVDCLAKAF